jgi:hypothetical protein
MIDAFMMTGFQKFEGSRVQGKNKTKGSRILGFKGPGGTK